MAVPKVDGQFIAEAIKYIDENGVPWHNTSTKYELVWKMEIPIHQSMY